MTTVMLVEDDPTIAQPLTRALSREKYDICAYTTGKEALCHLEDADLIILDLGLPDMDGLDVVRTIRTQGNDIPILILTARTSEIDIVVGLDSGADEYVTKPFRLAELLARVRALLRREHQESMDNIVRAQDVSVDITAHRAFQNGREIQLTAKEFELLRLLLEHTGDVLARDYIMQHVWGSDPASSTKTLDMHISWLRRKLGDAVARPRYITTVRGMGFRFEKR